MHKYKYKYKYQQLWILNIFMAANELCLFLLKLFSVYYYFACDTKLTKLAISDFNN